MAGVLALSSTSPAAAVVGGDRADKQCVTAYGSRRYDKRYTMCLGYPAGGVSACQGDSGGPVVVKGRLVGVISGGGSCRSRLYPGVAVKVAAYYPLLKNLTAR
ncbi:trypsin-like serine protease [Streptomyces chattanoogensis]|uniref:Peptidase S1 domain-containing protein n=1 Tax=Streptomyces chattanoogensis TaxID=66876 RepID=A0A0N0GVC4_9ACTN|nr:hypothetical protein ADL29_36555 [Streptomyces chattanoogensis]